MKEIMIALITALAVVLPLVTEKIITLISERRARVNKVIVGVLNVLPAQLRQYPDFTNYKKAIRSKTRVCILHCKNLSYALRFCDFVITDFKDPKCISPDDVETIEAIINTTDDQC